MSEENHRFRLVSPATREFRRQARRTPGYSFFDWLHGYVYGRWTYLYIGIGKGEHWLARVFGPPVLWVSRLLYRKGEGQSHAPTNGRYPQSGTFADGYHGKVVPLETASKLVRIGQDLSQPDLEQVIPYPRARAIILQNPDHIVVLDCPCRSAKDNPCLPLEVCLVVGEPFASFVSEHHPKRSRRISAEEAVEILRAEDARGHAHHAFFKDAMLGRFYAICNCCSCCCGAINAHKNGTPMLASSGFECRVDEALCVGCGTCAEYCQFGALSALDNLGRVDEALCMGCGVCVSKCPEGALSLARAPEKGLPLEICDLMVQALEPAGVVME